MKSGLSRLSYNQIIDKLSASYGIEPEYRDNRGRVHRTSIETKRSIFKAIGLNIDTKAQANTAWHAREEGKWLRMAEPTIVATLSIQPKELIFQIPRRTQGASPDTATKDLEVSLEVIDEDSVVQHFAFTHKDLSFYETKQVDNRVYERWSLPFPQLQTLGYYRFHLPVRTEAQQESQSIFVAICPDKAYIPPALQGDGRAAGIAISLYGVRSGRNWGVGDFGDLKEIVDWVAEDLHGDIVDLNPLHAIFNRRPFNTSPYLPISRFYRNFIYLDIPAMKDYQDSPEAQTLVNAPETQRLLSRLRASETVQYERVTALKQKVLKEVFQAFFENHWSKPERKTDHQRELENYIKREGLLLDNFATFGGALRTVINAVAEREEDKQKLLARLQDMDLLSADCDRGVRTYPEVTGEVHNAVVGFLALTTAKLFVLSQDDLFKEKDQQNLPGTTAEYPNWSLKMKYTVEQLRKDPNAKAFCDMFRDWIDRSGRNKRTV